MAKKKAQKAPKPLTPKQVVEADMKLAKRGLYGYVAYDEKGNQVWPPLKPKASDSHKSEDISPELGARRPPAKRKARKKK